MWYNLLKPLQKSGGTTNMKWKNDYKLGDELIDSQHEELFRRVESLIDIIMRADAASRKQECIDAILFLKDYAVNHFAAEEAFQESRGYSYLEFHKAIHSSFVNTVLEAEQHLIGTDFSVPTIKEFCGFLSMWLIYHVAGADQKIVSDEPISVAEFALAVSYEDCVLESLKGVLDTIIGDSNDVTKSSERVSDRNAVLIEIDYDETRVMRFVFPRITALSLVRIITNQDLAEVDELAYAVLLQFAKTICANAYSSMDNSRSDAETIDSDFFIETKYGRISISLVKR